MGDIRGLKKVVFILGMHRSGTSALTRMVNLLGISLGRNLLLGKTKINAKGFWENKEVIEIHDQIFEQLDSAWFDFRKLPDDWWLRTDIEPFAQRIVDLLKRDFEDQPIIALKDPRLCRLLPFWLDLLKPQGIEPACILTIRNPAEVARSLATRDGFDRVASSYLWLTYVLESEYYSRNVHRTLVCFDDLLSDWSGTAAQIARDLEIQWPLKPEEVQEQIGQELLPELKHHTAMIVDADCQADPCNKANEVYKRLVSNGLQESREYFDEARRWFSTDSPLSELLADCVYRTNTRLLERSRDLLKLGREHAQALDYIDTIRSHWAWKAARFVLKRAKG